MSDDLVNQLTLNFLISKNQLQKLNKKLRETTETNRRTDKEIYGDRITKLFQDLLVGQPPEDLLGDVNTGFDYFIDKAIYYFKAKDNHELLEQERTSEHKSEEIEIHDDIDFEKEERDIVNGNYKETNYNEYGEKEAEEEDEEDEERDLKEDLEDEIDETPWKTPYTPVNITQKWANNRNSHSVGVDDIQKLPLNWFQNIKQQNNQNRIIPRRKDNIN